MRTPLFPVALVAVYGVGAGPNGKAVAYIEAKDSAEFEVVLRDQRALGEIETSYSVRLFVDGQRVSGKPVDHEGNRFYLPPAHSQRSQVFQGKRTSATSRAPMLFGKLRLIDDADLACADEKLVKNLGSIRMDYWRIKNMRRRHAGYHVYSGAPSSQAVHEQAKKASALSHQAECVPFNSRVRENFDLLLTPCPHKFGIAQPARSAHSYDYDLIDARETPFSTVEFRYRSRRLLQLEGLVPASSPEPQDAPVGHSPTPDLVLADPSAPRRLSSSNGGASGSPSSGAADPSSVAAKKRRLAELRAEIERLEGHKDELVLIDEEGKPAV
ncbi:hypothetical protein JCM8547_003235 [Rhodosporidiobolus lusitaniae]